MMLNVNISPTGSFTSSALTKARRIPGIGENAVLRISRRASKASAIPKELRGLSKMQKHALVHDQPIRGVHYFVRKLSEEEA